MYRLIQGQEKWCGKMTFAKARAVQHANAFKTTGDLKSLDVSFYVIVIIYHTSWLYKSTVPYRSGFRASSHDPSIINPTPLEGYSSEHVYFLVPSVG